MWPARIGSPSAGTSTGSDAARPRTSGNALLTPGDMCQTTNSDAGKSSGRWATRFCRACMPPADAPATTMSLFTRPVQHFACLRGLVDLVHEQDDAVARPVRASEGRAAHAAANALAPAVVGVERDVARFALARKAGAHDGPHLRHRQADVEGEEGLAAHFVGAQAPQVLGALVPYQHVVVAIEHHGARAQALQHRFEERVAAARLLGARAQLVVDRLQLLVGRLELLVHGLELLVGRLQLLVRGFELLVGGLQLLVGGLELLVGR